ncbi:MAG: GNAT family N-acetyltransferase [Aureispira sp.]|nr:GNAT family N-acetyltransferase [Aureispira sp.]
MKYEIKLLQDKSKLQEIYDLRVHAWENSPSKKTINKSLFPKGWFDEADKDSFIWYLSNEENKIIATARLTYLNNLSQLKKLGVVFHDIKIPEERPFGFFSRLVIHKNFRGKGIAKLFDLVRLEKLKKDNIRLGLIEVNNKRVAPLSKLGFIKIGFVKFKPASIGEEEVLNLMSIEY